MKNPKTILITGASSGLGQELALNYAQNNINLCLTGRNENRLKSVAEACINKGAYVKIICLDVTEKIKLAAWINDCDANFPIDLVIANAGISGGTSGKNGENSQQVRSIMATNIDGVLNSILPAIHKMQARKSGQIAIISSMAAFRPLPSCPAYCASKAAVRFYGEALRGQLKDDNIGVTVICPGYIHTPMTEVNKFPMPMLMSSQKAARIIIRKLRKNPTRIVFPRLIYWIVTFLAYLPPAITNPIFNHLPKK